MSIIIKGLDMPKDCVGLSIVIHTENNMSRPLIIYKKDIIEIPTPHGRLIAEGSITDQLQEIEDITALSHIDLGEEPYDDTDEIMLPISTIRKILDRCITILEAETEPITFYDKPIGEPKEMPTTTSAHTILESEQ